MLSTVLNILMFEDCRNQWSMSRPLLGLILLNEDYFQSLRDQVRKNNSLLKIVKSCQNGKKLHATSIMGALGPFKKA